MNREIGTELINGKNDRVVTNSIKSYHPVSII